MHIYIIYIYIYIYKYVYISFYEMSIYIYQKYDIYFMRIIFRFLPNLRRLNKITKSVESINLKTN